MEVGRRPSVDCRDALHALVVAFGADDRFHVCLDLRLRREVAVGAVGDGAVNLVVDVRVELRLGQLAILDLGIGHGIRSNLALGDSSVGDCSRNRYVAGQVGIARTSSHVSRQRNLYGRIKPLGRDAEDISVLVFEF